MSIFVSYSSRSSDIANEIAYKLQDLNYSVWIDRTKEHVKWTKEDFDIVSKAVASSSVFICFVDKEYCNDKNTKTELSFAHAQKTKVIPIMMEKETNHSIDPVLLNYHKFIAFKNSDAFETWPDELFKELLTAIKLNLNSNVKI